VSVNNPTAGRIDTMGPLDSGQLTQFLDNPVEFLCATMASELKKIPQWTEIYGDFIDGYMRMDYDIRNLPALRIYNESGTKEHESWFINGDIKVDSILPASLRRTETQQIQDTLTGALIQQLRSMDYFVAVEANVPGLNELGKVFAWDKTLGFQFEEEMVPLTQITLNFRLDQRIWDDHLESEGRTKNIPFEVTLGNLRKIASTIQALKDDGSKAVTVPDAGEDIIPIKGGT
jgi:hypothetical protein